MDDAGTPYRVWVMLCSMDHPADLVFALGGISDSSTLHQNFTRGAIRRALGDGSIVRVGRDRYALRNRDDALEVARRVNGYLILESAALHWGWEVRLPPAAPTVAVPRGRGEVEGVVRLDVQREDLDGWATNKLQTALMCAADLPFEDALAVVDSALRHRDVSHVGLERAAGAMPGARGHRARRIIAIADPRAANPFESALRACAIEAGLQVVAQYRVEAAGLVLHADLADPFLGVILEAESWEHHGKHRTDFVRDCARYSAMTSVGWRVLRFTWHEVIHEAAAVAALIRATRDLARSCGC